MEHYAQLYKNELFENVIPFWMRHSKDETFGGYFTCLDRQGRVFDTDKFIWLQGRQVWLFSMLYDQAEHRPEWLAMALHGADFLEKHGTDGLGNWYFSLDRTGRPLVQPYNIFSDCFAAMAFGGLYKATGQEKHAKIARRTFENILARQHNPKGQYSKAYPGTRELKNFSLPMILCNLSVELGHLLDANLTHQLAENLLHEVMEVFYQSKEGLILENVSPDGTFNDSFEGRLLNPGHALEAMWFVMDLGVRMQNQAVIDKAVEIALRTLEYGWDKEYGGIFYFLDIKGAPPQQLEWDQKLWWVHLEALVCMAKAWKLTGNQQARTWFETLHQYAWSHFRDPEYGEWYGYLNRRGEVLLPLKGGKWKGCFHVPRALWQVSKTLEQTAAPEKIVTQLKY